MSTTTMQQLLDMYPDAPIQIISGEGEGAGTVEDYDGRDTVAAIRARLEEERCGGDRWARAVIYEGENDYGEFGADLETGEQRPWA